MKIASLRSHIVSPRAATVIIIRLSARHVRNRSTSGYRTLSSVPSAPETRERRTNVELPVDTREKNTRVVGLTTKFSTFQVEGSASTIDLGRVSIIPPISERSTASNISFEEGGEFNVPKKCKPLSKESPVSHGVRSGPADSGAVFGMAPLLSPTTEKELLREADWPCDLFASAKTPRASGPEEDCTVFPIWEENYQDLSGWCMDPFQGRCAFPIGEFEENRHSGTKNEDFGVSTKKGEVMIAQEPRGFLVGKESLGRSTLKDMALPFVVNPQFNIVARGEEDSLPAIKAEIAEPRAPDLYDVLLDPTEASLRTEDWVQLEGVRDTNDPTIITQRESPDAGSIVDVVAAEYPGTIPPFELAKNEKDNWDVINTLENTGTDAFDLLSYLCDDNIQSPDDSVSRDSGPTIKSTSSLSSPGASSSRELRNTGRGKAEDVSESGATSSSASSSIAAISAALDSVTKMSRQRSSRGQKRAARTRKTSERSVEDQQPTKKRCVDSDSEDRMSDCSYRESREKNNEASRKSRMNKKAKETEMMARAGELERDNRILKMKVEELEKLVTSMRSTILRSALRRSS